MHWSCTWQWILHKFRLTGISAPLSRSNPTSPLTICTKNILQGWILLLTICAITATTYQDVHVYLCHCKILWQIGPIYEDFTGIYACLNTRNEGTTSKPNRFWPVSIVLNNDNHPEPLVGFWSPPQWFTVTVTFQKYPWMMWLVILHMALEKSLQDKIKDLNFMTSDPQVRFKLHFR